MPQHEFLARMAKLWEVGGGDVAGAIVFGSPQHHAAPRAVDAAQKRTRA